MISKEIGYPTRLIAYGMVNIQFLKLVPSWSPFIHNNMENNIKKAFICTTAATLLVI
jgi:hypothetical protein